jgi:hypothetical protein
LNTWTHVAGTANGSVAKSYMNGVEVGSVAAGATYEGYSIPNNFIGGGHGYFNGLIDDVRIYNRALSAAEIQAIYNATK